MRGGRSRRDQRIPILRGLATVIDLAVCIRHWDWSETSQTVSLFSRGHGVIRGLAKGSRREKGRFSGGIELLTLGEVTAIIKPDNALSLLTAWDLRDPFPALRRSLHAFHAGMYAAELVQHMVTDADPHEGLFDSLVATLRDMADPSRIARAVLAFQWATLVETGLKPELVRDVSTGEPLTSVKVVGFAPRLGGFVALADRGTSGYVWPVRRETLLALRAIAEVSHLDIAPATTDRANRLLASYLREVIGRELPAQSCLFPDLKTHTVPRRK